MKLTQATIQPDRAKPSSRLIASAQDSVIAWKLFCCLLRAPEFAARAREMTEMSWNTIVHRFKSILSPTPAPASAGGIVSASVRKALERPGCPVCHIVADHALRSLEAILWEQVTDPATHERLLSARGFCYEHGWALLVASKRVYSHCGVALLLQRVLNDLLSAAEREDVRGARRWLDPLTGCPICARSATNSDGFSRELAALYYERPNLIREMVSIPCVPHLQCILKHLNGVTRDEVEMIVTARQRACVLSSSVEETVATLIGYRPPHLPAGPFRCPACAVRLTRLASMPAKALTRLEIWSLIARDPSAFDRALNEPPPESSMPATDLAVAEDLIPVLSARAPIVADLCLGHLRALVSLNTSGVLWHECMVSLKRLSADLDRVICRFDYRFHGTLNERERQSWYAVLARFAGEMPEVNLHAAARDRSRGVAWNLFGAGGIR